VDVWWKMLLDEVRQEPYEIVAASLVAHGQVQSRVPRFRVRKPPSGTLTQNPEKPKTET
jgi:hypothetical protein